MRTPFVPLALFGFFGVVRAAEPPGFSFDIRVNIADQREVHLAATVPDRTTHLLQVDDTLGLELRIETMAGSGRWITAVLLDRNGNGNRRLVLSDWPLRDQELWQPQWVSFSVCGGRFIAVRGAAPGRCADLPPMATPGRLLGGCGTTGNICLGPYEDMPATITSRERLAPASEPGVPLRVTGRVLGADGRPRAGVIVYGYQTDRRGIYPPVAPPRSSSSNYHGRLRGWVRSDAQGRYTFDTIRPGSYGGNPEHIHMHVVEPGCATYSIDDLIFAGDPNFLRLSPQQRQSETHGKGGSGVTTPRRRGQGWEVTRDIHLGEDIPDYRPCPTAAQ